MLIPFVLILIHFIADFIFQAEDWANNKSKKNIALFKHVLTYSVIWLFLIRFVFLIEFPNETTDWYIVNSSLFAGITFITHFITDYITSRIVSKKFTNKHYGSPIPNFGAFTVIGLDQVLHYAQLMITYTVLTQNF